MSRLSAQEANKKIDRHIEVIKSSYSGEYGWIFWRMALMIAAGLKEIISALAEINHKLEDK